jgi:hypothetical protein
MTPETPRKITTMRNLISKPLALAAVALIASMAPALSADKSQFGGTVQGLTCGAKPKLEIRTVEKGRGVGGGDKAIMASFPVTQKTEHAGLYVTALPAPKQAIALLYVSVDCSYNLSSLNDFKSKALVQKAKSAETYVVDGKFGTGQDSHKDLGGGWRRMHLMFPVPAHDHIVAFSFYGPTKTGRDIAHHVTFGNVFAHYGGYGTEDITPKEVTDGNGGCKAMEMKQ